MRNTDTGNTESTLSDAISSARDTITTNTDTEISSAKAAIITDTGNTESTLSTAISSARDAVITDTGNTESTLSTAISSARDAVITDTGNTETALSTAIANEKLTVTEAGASPSANTDIVDTHANILTLLGSEVHSNIRSIDILSGDTLKLTSAQFQRLLDAEAPSKANGVLFAGKIKLDTTLSGTYAEVYSQITDYRIALEEGFAASEYSSTVSNNVTVAQAETLRVAGLTMSSQTYTIEDSLTLTKAQADSDTGGVLANAAEVIINSGVILDTGTLHSDLNTVAGVAGGKITATIQGTGTSLADAGLNNLGTSDQVTFRIDTSATPAQVHTLSDRTGNSYKIDFSTNNANLTGAYTDFISAGNASNTTDFDEVIAHTDNVPITLSGVTLNDSSVQNPDLNRLFAQAEGAVTVTITDNTESVLGDTLTISADDKVSINFGTKTATDSIISAINALAQQGGLLSITGTLNGVTASMVGDLHADLDSGNSTINFNMATDATGLLSVSAAHGLLSHTDTSNATVNFGGGISDALSAYAESGDTKSTIDAIVTEDTDVAITVTGTLGSSSQDITDLNAIASKFQETGLTATISATVSTAKANLYNSETSQAILGTDTTDTIAISVSDALSPSEWAAIKAKTGSTVTASAGFSGALSQYAAGGFTALNFRNAVANNGSAAVTITGTLGASDIANLNAVASYGSHSGAITASVSAELSEYGVDSLSITNSDPVAVEVTDALTNANLADLKTLKGKTSGKVTASITDTADNLSGLNTGSGDEITMSVSGTSDIADSIAITGKTDAISRITIAKISDTQGNISGNDVASSASLTALKTQLGVSTTADALDGIYARVTSGTVELSGGAITVDNAIPISTFTVGSSGSITYSISDTASGAGSSGLATASSAVNTAITNASSVTATGTMTVDEAVEMLGGVTDTVARDKFTYSIDDTFSAVTTAEQAASGTAKKIAHTRADAVTLTLQL